MSNKATGAGEIRIAFYLKYTQLAHWGGLIAVIALLALSARASAAPTISIASPAQGAQVPSGIVVVDFSVLEFTIGPAGQSHVHFYLDGDSTRYDFYDDPSCDPGGACVAYQGTHTHFAHWRDGTSIEIFGLSAGPHTVRFALANANHGELANPGASVTLNFTAAAPPSAEFELIPMIGSLNFPARMAFAPDGRIFFNEKNTGKIRIIHPGWALQTTEFYQFPVRSASEQGLLGIALDPNFTNNGYVYTYQTVSNPWRNRVVRLTDAGGQGANETVILDNLPASNVHNAGALVFGPDGKLYVTDGDASQSSQSQNVAYLGGKVLRLNSDGSTPNDGPIAGSPVYAFGLRNSYGLAFHPHTQDIWISENGPGSDDEINRIVPGGNYGWPTVMGIANDSRFLDPILEYTPTIAPTGIIVIGESTVYPSEYHDNLLFLAWNDGKIRRVRLAGAELDQLGSVSIAYNGGEGGLVDLQQGLDGYIYVCSGSEIFRLSLVGAPPPPGNTGPFIESGGQVVIEAESATLITRGHSWVKQTSPAGGSGGEHLLASPNNGTNHNFPYVATSPEAQAAVNFSSAGVYYVWVRNYSNNGADNSCHVGLDGVEASSADRINEPTSGAWGWTNETMDNARALIVVPNAGLHTVNVWMREDGFRFDKLLLTKNANFTPAGLGPAESPRQSGGGANTPPTVSLTASNGPYTAPASISLTATAADSDGSVTKVEFYSGLTLLFSDTTAPFSYNWSGVAAGSYSLSARAYDDDGDSTASNTINLTVNPPSGGGGSGAFLESGGQVVMEAESGEIVNRGHSWVNQTTPAGASGDAHLLATPNNGVNRDSGYAGNSPEVQFIVNFGNAGTYYVWVRNHSASAADNSCNVGLDGAESSTADRISEPTLNSWDWTNETMDGPRATIVVPSAGLHTVNLWMREDGFRFDKLLLTTSSGFTPSGLGPGESARSGGGGNNPPSVSLSVVGGPFTAPANIAFTATASDSDGSIQRVELYHGAQLLQTEFFIPYQFNWNNVAAGSYALTAKAFDDDGASTTSAALNITVSPPGGGSGAFLESGGLVAMEAESGVIVNRGHSWVSQTSPAGASGGVNLLSTPDNGTVHDSNYAGNSPEVRFAVNFANAGTYYVWVRNRSANTAGNSCHVGLNGVGLSSADRITEPTLGVWDWTNETMDGPRATIVIPSPGVHTVNLWMREDGIWFDKLVLTNSAGFTPSGNGPSESSRAP